MEDMSGIDIIVGEVKNIVVKGVKYQITACTIDELSMLSDLLRDLFGKKDADLIRDKEAQKIMAKIMYLGLKEHQPNMTLADITKTFSLSAFAVILKIILDLNTYTETLKSISTPVQEIVNLKPMHKKK